MADGDVLPPWARTLLVRAHAAAAGRGRRRPASWRSARAPTARQARAPLRPPARARAAKVSGHTFSGAFNPEFSPKVKLSAPLVEFPPLQPGGAGHQTVAVVNYGDTPVGGGMHRRRGESVGRVARPCWRYRNT